MATNDISENQVEHVLDLLIKINVRDPELSDWQRQFAADQVERGRRWGPDLHMSPKQYRHICLIASRQGIAGAEAVADL